MEESANSNVTVVAAKICVVGFLWGITNPFLGKGARTIKVDAPWWKVWLHIKGILLNWRFVVPFLFNQCGSVVYYLLLGDLDLAICVPGANGVAFAVTGLTELLLFGMHRGAHMLPVLFGSLLIIAGFAICLHAEQLPT
eukprot:GEMP01061139.1.p2 GENE.GEMP01061139.1~~GEMP01061139.1.p2  ORF type:complete len:139 (+),score=26.62 GEMP01061139.1:135-551(+)